MAAKKRKPDLTVEADSLTTLADKPRGNARQTSEGVVTSYDPAMAALTEAMRRQTNWAKVLRKLDACLVTAAAIKNKRGTELVELLHDARRQVALIDPR